MTLPKFVTGKISLHLLRKVLQDKLADAIAVAVIALQKNLALAQEGLVDLQVPGLVTQADFPHNVLFGDPFGFH